MGTQKGAEQVDASAAPDSARLAVVNEDADHRVALFGPLVLSVWIHTRVEALRAMEKTIHEAAPGAPHGRVGLFVVVQPQSSGLPSAARQELARIRRDGPIELTVLVYAGDGFGAALVRGITTSLNLLEPPQKQTHVFADVPPAARWIETKAPSYGRAAAIEAAVQTLRHGTA